MFDFFGYYTKQNSQPQELKIDNRKQDLPNLIENDDYTKKYDELYYIHKLNMNKIEENYRKELEQERKNFEDNLKKFQINKYPNYNNDNSQYNSYPYNNNNYKNNYNNDYSYNNGYNNPLTEEERKKLDEDKKIEDEKKNCKKKVGSKIEKKCMKK